MSGLLIGGKLYEIDGLQIISPGQFKWAVLDARDYKFRTTSWIRQIVNHTTKGIWPQKVLPGKGACGRGKIVADFWRNDPEHSAAQIVIDNDGSVVCLCDLLKFAAHHATVSNEWSIGIEIYQEAGGGIYQAALDTAVRLNLWLADFFGIPLFVPGKPYANAPLKRMAVRETNADCVGIFGHRDNTHRRGRGDPGDEFFRLILLHGAMGVDYYALEDTTIGTRIQRYLNRRYNSRLSEDGVLGPSSVNALRKNGLWFNGFITKTLVMIDKEETV